MVTSCKIFIWLSHLPKKDKSTQQSKPQNVHNWAIVMPLADSQTHISNLLWYFKFKPVGWKAELKIIDFKIDFLLQARLVKYFHKWAF